MSGTATAGSISMYRRPSLNAIQRVTFRGGNSDARLSAGVTNGLGSSKANSHSSCLGPLQIHALPVILGRVSSVKYWAGRNPSHQKYW